MVKRKRYRFRQGDVIDVEELLGTYSLQQVRRSYRCEMEKRNFLRKPVPEMDGRTERGALWHLSNVRSAWRVQVPGKSERHL